MNNKVIIIGGGPAGLTAGLEFLNKTSFQPIILERLDQVGGISKTINYKGNRIDIGGHRFFSKSDVVMNWWLDILPHEDKKDEETKITYRNSSRSIDTKKSKSVDSDKTMLVRGRLSRIFYLRKFFDYPIKINIQTVANLGLPRIFRILFSYIKARISPIKDEKSLEDFFINRFGNELYSTFFKDYTEKVWGVPCHEIKADWGSQRIKGLSISKAIWHFAKSLFKKENSIGQKGVETSLIEKFLYPKLGPGQLWEEVADQITEKGGIINFNEKVTKITFDGNKIKSVFSQNTITKEIVEYQGDYVLSTMPIKDLFKSFDNIVIPKKAFDVSQTLVYRDFITVGLLLKKLKISNVDGSQILDNWIYIQESDVKIGRLQVFNNWSPYMVADPNNTWIGLEYFCNEGDELWNKSEDEMRVFAIDELQKIGIIEKSDVLDGVVVKVPKTYPAYTGSYEHFSEVKDFVNTIPNLFLVGRNGMHKYNNQDHSMLTAIEAVKNISNNILTKDNIWEINTEEDYHEEK